MNEKTNLQLSEKISGLMDSFAPGKAYVCYVAYNVKDGEEEKIAVDSPIDFKKATVEDMLAFWGSIIRIASINAIQFVDSLPKESRDPAIKFLMGMAHADMTGFQKDI